MQHHFTRLIRLRIAFGFFTAKTSHFTQLLSQSQPLWLHARLFEKKTLCMSLCKLIISFSVCSGHTDNWTGVAIISLTAKLSNTLVAVTAIVGKFEMKSISPLDAFELARWSPSIRVGKEPIKLLKTLGRVSSSKLPSKLPLRESIEINSASMGELLNSLSGRFVLKGSIFAPMSPRCLQS